MVMDAVWTEETVVQAFKAKRFSARLMAAGLIVVAIASQVGRGAPSSVDAERQAVFEAMVKNALAAVNHANLTGNYTVLRDLGSEAFRRRNSAADLAGIFSDLRQRRYDLSPVLCLSPRFAEPQAEVQTGCLQLVGFFDTQPEAVHFTVVYQEAEEGWALDEVSVATGPTDAAAHEGLQNR
jgi:hypothetical protein